MATAGQDLFRLQIVINMAIYTSKQIKIYTI